MSGDSRFTRTSLQLDFTAGQNGTDDGHVVTTLHVVSAGPLPAAAWNQLRTLAGDLRGLTDLIARADA